MVSNQAICRAHTNIALIKYWGKRDVDKFLPMNSSLSLTLDGLYTDTRVIFDDHLTRDHFILNGAEQQDSEVDKISRFLDLFRERAGVKTYARVDSTNHVPTAAGLASSASAFAALAGAARQALNIDMSDQELSTYARRGSGSATRSIFGGFVEWQMGTNSANSMAVKVDDGLWDIGMVIIALNKQQKKISSRKGMRHTVESSPFYESWKQVATDDLEKIKLAIEKRDINKIGQIAEANAMRMHATTLAADPPFTYFEPDSLRAMEAVRAIRKQGIPAYYTMDAGPNVKVLCRLSDAEAIRQQLLTIFDDSQLLVTGTGPGIQILSTWEENNDD